jgi:bleomycin hydrolase
MRKLLLASVLALTTGVMAQQQAGGITPQMLQEIQKQNTPSVSDRALRNALAANSIDELAKNQDNAVALDTYFSVETKKQSITDQKSSGRCWMFSGLNVLRANFAKRTDSLTVSFSHDYLFF